ncbi:EamA-like transporter family [Bifidobacterium sp. DSM 109958]|uniref:EamA-like transporter family n=1 Tax=Bifidobacterium moraviense TaxID=2675323 RepID=A0A7Y0F2J7_9BIFI|nr:aromatic amino acid DMT transporter YddG [Bifidobacterium sp. DSM 109958]NMN00837.1 EamA-like transporter family [Bifidobacterium sp. DSM 109958]
MAHAQRHRRPTGEPESGRGTAVPSSPVVPSSPAVRATAIGLLAILLWSLMTGLVRVVADAFGATLGSALIYTFGVVLLMIFRRPAPLREYPRRYLLVGGALFVFYESAISLSIGLASSEEGSVEVSLVNYLWPTMMVLLAAAFAAPAEGSSRGQGPSRGRAVLRVLPGAVVATVGVALAVGGNSGLDWGLAARHIGDNPLPYALAFCGAFAWSVYAVFTPAMARGKDGTSVFFPLVAVALWIIHFASGQGWPAAVPPFHAWLAVLAAAAVIAGGYACWGYGILHGNMSTLALASYATPLLSTAASAVLLGLSLTLPFWCGALLVALGSMLNWWLKSRARAR